MLSIVFSAFVSCNNSTKFKVANGNVGYITTKTTVQELDYIFKNDSIVKNLSEGSLGDHNFQEDDEYLIFEKGGKHLLTIVPKEPLDSLSTIKRVEIFDNRFTTKKEMSLSATFSDLNLNYKINKIESTLLSATLFIDELNATIVIDKEELGLRDYAIQKISVEQIPDLAKMKSFIIWFH